MTCACNWCVLGMCTRSGSPYNVMHSSGSSEFKYMYKQGEKCTDIIVKVKLTLMVDSIPVS